MDTVLLDVDLRQTQDNPRDLRINRYIPAVFYGVGNENLNLKVAEGVFKKVYKMAGENTVLDLVIDNGAQKKKVLVHRIERDPVSDRIIHIDFINVNMAKEITTHIPLEISGTAPAVKDLGGVLNVSKYSLTIRCLPGDLVHSISVDIASLVDLHSIIRVKDIVIPEKWTLMDDLDDVVVNAVPPRQEEVVEAAPTEAPAESEKSSGEGQAAAEKSAEKGE